MFINKKINWFLALTLLLASTATMAVPQYCVSKIKYATVRSGGLVVVQSLLRNEGFRVCNLEQTVDGISPVVCAAWFTLLRSAVTNQENIALWYANAPSCETMPVGDVSIYPGIVQLVD